jgi:hypothetical protein
MTIRRTVIAVAALAAVASWACSSSSTENSSGGEAAATCPPDDPETKDRDESKCRALANPEDGALAVQRRNCANCHTKDFGGAKDPLPTINNDVVPEGVKLYPPNLTSDTTGVGEWSDEQLALAIRQGIDRKSQQLCPQMKHDNGMSDFEAYSIVLYLRTLPKVQRTVPQSVCPPFKL